MIGAKVLGEGEGVEKKDLRRTYSGSFPDAIRRAVLGFTVGN